MTGNGYSDKMGIDGLNWLRMPLAVCIIFIHSFGIRKMNYSQIVAHPFSAESIYDVLRYTCSYLITDFAVPTFFIISGYLFFLKFDHWDWGVYASKLKRRIHTLLIPYIGWNIFHFVHLYWAAICKVFAGKATIASLGRLIAKLGYWRIFWDCHCDTSTSQNIIGQTLYFQGPVLAPLWYLRDLMVIVLLAPMIYYLIKRFGWWFVGLLVGLMVLNINCPIHGLSTISIGWFSIGAICAIQKINPIANAYRVRWAAAAVSLVLLLISVYLVILQQGQSTPLLQINRNIYKLTSATAIIGFAGWVQLGNRMQWIGKLAGASFFVYCAHIFMRKQVLNATIKLCPHNYPCMTIHYFLVPLITAACCIIVWHTWQRIRMRLKSSFY